MGLVRKIIGVKSIILVCFWGQVFAQPAYHVQVFDAKNGLPLTAVSAVVEDKLGYLWIGTVGGGLTRFDGSEFVTFTVSDGLYSNSVTGLKFDRQGNLWVNHRTGISKFNGHNFLTYEIKSAQERKKVILMLAMVGDSLMYSGNGNLFGYIYKDILYESTPFNLGDSTFVIGGYSFSDSLVFLRQSNNKLRCIERNKVSYHDIPSKSFERNYMGARFSKYKNGLLIAMANGDKYRFDIQKREFQEVYIPFFPIYSDEHTNIEWFQWENNLCIRSISTGLIDTIALGLSVNQIIKDRQGIIWVATSKGLLKITEKSFKLLYKIDNPVMGAAMGTDGAIWVGTAFNGIRKVHKNKVEILYDKMTSSRNQVNQLMRDSKGRIWAATKGGLGLYNSNQNKFDWMELDHLKLPPWVNSISESKDGSIWLATINAGGVYRLKDEKFIRYTEKDGLNSNSTTVIYASDFYNKVFTGQSDVVSIIGESNIDELKIHALKGSILTSIDSYQDSIIYFGSLGVGLVFYNPISGIQKVVNKASGLPSDFIYFAKTAPDNSIWVGSQVGFTKVQLDSEFNISSIQHFGEYSGLGEVEANQFSYYIKTDTVIFGTTDGLYQLNAHVNYSVNNKLHVSKVELYHGEQSLWPFAQSEVMAFTPPTGVELPYNQNHLTFHFNVVEKLAAVPVKFRYYLKGFDKSWSGVTIQKKITYPNIPPGKYSLRVMATDLNGKWVPQPVIYNFTIHPPFYLTKAFITSSALLLFAITVVVINYIVTWRYTKVVKMKEIQMAERDRIRKDLVKDFHDEMGNYLVRIISYVNLLRVENNQHYSKETLFTKVEETSRKLYTGMRDLIWTIDQQTDKVDSIFINLKDFGDQVLTPVMEFRAYNRVNLQLGLKQGFGRHILLIFKEAMTNVLKHSQATRCEIIVEEDSKAIYFTVADNGVGIKHNERSERPTGSDGMGLANFKERASRIGASISITSSSETGTIIKLIISKKHSIAKGNDSPRSRFLFSLKSVSNN